MRTGASFENDIQARVVRARVEALLAGAVLVLGGSAMALWLPLGLAAAIGMGILMRLCWLDDNIRNDLMGATRIPESYRQTQLLQASWRQLLLGRTPDPVECPRRLASLMRVQVHALHAFFCGTALGFLVRGVEQPAAALIVGGALLGCGLWRVERLAEAEAALARDTVLSDEMLEDRGPLARFVMHR